ncbi:PrsW family glutamic-type intramembrane protease [Lutibacter sp. TH_r2]|uniref:PrsW family intramembrane metalloprotease n=1 Tax=Lutibacter sp. TH_r2 TaxID=3082083 RepID=UPI0029546C6B|nr:PrsW family glutamic-type intramembrane protease [Lutibacter sp. TH_r2]MDV7188091.1 PrsW family glutamic-type intramembrane protease [Lutibacter sp. TH_r2]
MTAFIIAAAPVVFIIIYIYIKDKFEKESKRVLFYNFLLGAILSILISTLLYFLQSKLFSPADEFSVVDQFIQAFFVVALIEEFSKYILVYLGAQKRPFFNEPFDGIIYCVMVSMGFAFVENIMYVLDGGLYTAILRAFTAVPAHATFGVIMGYFMGKAKFSNKRILWNLIGLSAAILFHGAYDFFLFIHFIPGISIGAFVSLIIGIVLSRKAIKHHQNASKFK